MKKSLIDFFLGHIYKQHFKLKQRQLIAGDSQFKLLKKINFFLF